MRSFTVHRRRRTIGDPQAEAESTVFVRESFSWLALLFPVLWFLYHRMWIVLLGFVTAALAINAIVSALEFPESVNIICSIGLQVLVGAEANNLRRWTLDRAGHDVVGVVLGRGVIEAEARYFRNWHAALVAHQQAHAAGDEVEIAYRAPTPAQSQPQSAEPAAAISAPYTREKPA